MGSSNCKKFPGTPPVAVTSLWKLATTFQIQIPPPHRVLSFDFSFWAACGICVTVVRWRQPQGFLA